MESVAAMQPITRLTAYQSFFAFLPSRLYRQLLQSPLAFSSTHYHVISTYIHTINTPTVNNIELLRMYRVQLNTGMQQG